MRPSFGTEIPSLRSRGAPTATSNASTLSSPRSSASTPVATNSSPGIPSPGAGMEYVLRKTFHLRPERVRVAPGQASGPHRRWSVAIRSSPHTRLRPNRRDPAPWPSGQCPASAVLSSSRRSQLASETRCMLATPMGPYRDASRVRLPARHRRVPAEHGLTLSHPYCYHGTWLDNEPHRSAAASLPAMRPCTVQRPMPCWLKPPADSPPQ